MKAKLKFGRFMTGFMAVPPGMQEIRIAFLEPFNYADGFYASTSPSYADVKTKQLVFMFTGERDGDSALVFELARIEG